MTALFREFGELVKKLRCKNDKSDEYELLTDDSNDGKKERLRRGFFPVYVGEERKKFWVPVSKSSTLKCILDHYVEEYNPSEPISMPRITPEMFNCLLEYT
ncbi:unnamed protein product [Fraxinus pennsylvanica]|uniref:Uncharacterized protein n=1 Tax=Fraxinus pennsylvanica TaxID=56036 RepID=A0AAD1YX60_9LAMI|nr:unnamed protein product [Fraxinus pennsylvanica]